jgi:hypothetical protein
MSGNFRNPAVYSGDLSGFDHISSSILTPDEINVITARKKGESWQMTPQHLLLFKGQQASLASVNSYTPDELLPLSNGNRLCIQSQRNGDVAKFIALKDRGLLTDTTFFQAHLHVMH